MVGVGAQGAQVGAQVGAAVAHRARPVSMATEQTLDVLPPLSGLLPEGGLRRGTTLWVAGPGSVSLLLALLAGPSATGSWAGVVGLGDLGLVAAAEMGVDVDRLALVTRPGPQWPTVVAALVDAFDIVVLQPPGRVRATDARRLTARVRERGAVLLLAGGDQGGAVRARIWPEAPALSLTVITAGWQGLEQGSGHLAVRQVEVTAEGRGVASRPRRVRLWLPGPGGGVEAVSEKAAVIVPARPAAHPPVRPTARPAVPPALSPEVAVPVAAAG